MRVIRNLKSAFSGQNKPTISHSLRLQSRLKFVCSQSLIPLCLQFLWDLIQKHYSTSLIFRKRRLPVIRITYVAFVHLAKHRSPSQFCWAPDEARLEYSTAYTLQHNGTTSSTRMEKKLEWLLLYRNLLMKFVHGICSWTSLLQVIICLV